MFTCAAAIVLACVFQRDRLTRPFRIGLLLVTGLAAFAAFTLIRDVFLESGNEAQNSALYRTQLLDLTTSMSPFGLSSEFQISASRQVSIGDFGSVDNALLLFGLIYGWVPLALDPGGAGWPPSSTPSAAGPRRPCWPLSLSSRPWSPSP